MTEEQGREGSVKGFRTETMCQTKGTPTPVSNGECMFKKKNQPSQTDQVQNDAIQSLIERDFQIQGLNSDHQV